MAKKSMLLKDYMKPSDLKKFKHAGDPPTYHSNCIALTGVARPGKTARDRARRNQ